MSGPHEFTGISYGVADRHCTTCGKADRDPIHAGRAAAPPVEPDFDAASAAINPCTRPGCKCRYAPVPPPDLVAGLREALTTLVAAVRNPMTPSLMPAALAKADAALLAEPVPSETDDD